MRTDKSAEDAIESTAMVYHLVNYRRVVARVSNGRRGPQQFNSRRRTSRIVERHRLAASGRWAGTETPLINASVLVPAKLALLVATSFTCDGMTALGLTRSLITYAASFGPVVKASPIFITASLACSGRGRPFCSAVMPVSPEGR